MNWNNTLNCEVWASDGSKIAYVNNKANARLIAQAPMLLQALKNLTKEIDLGKLKIKKDFHLINAHSWALKVIYQAEEKEGEK